MTLAELLVQLIDAEACGFPQDVLVVVLREVDSSLWDVRAAEERVFTELRGHYQGAVDL
ncbi:hypothetical protein [Streptomyces sp. NPDC056361]|uniref:hypothetical protein n=1 Tax=Streptomyces sp. NPDC056361 TaxID=3345795 RepID=UPI0035E33328